MKAVLAAIAILAATPLAAADNVSLAGVADQETTIPSGGIREFFLGHGDVMFVRDTRNQWYRLGLNDGCLANMNYVENAWVETRDIGGRIDRLATINLSDGLARPCAINSIRKSVAPPQVDSKSPITLD